MMLGYDCEMHFLPDNKESHEFFSAAQCNSRTEGSLIQGSR